jgi:DNA anti-recombination protein RmuC
MDEELELRFDAMMRRINDNHERLLLELRGTQTDVRSVKAEIASTRTFIDARASQTEALITQLFDRLNARMDQSERSIEERLRKLEDGRSKPSS